MNWQPVRVVEKLLRDEMNASVAGNGKEIYLREGLRKALDSEYVQIVRDPDSGSYGVRACSKDDGCAVKILHSHAFPAKPVIDQLGAKPKDVLRVHHLPEAGVYVFLRPASDTESEDTKQTQSRKKADAGKRQ